MSKEAVQKFYRRLAQDSAFYNKLQNSKTKGDCCAIVQAAGYDFTQAELTDYTAAFLESKTADAELRHIGAKELEAIIGGTIALTFSDLVAPPYGHFSPN
jgi:predicted ribosomally synthesized peptide with nif11-like leader